MRHLRSTCVRRRHQTSHITLNKQVITERRTQYCVWLSIGSVDGQGHTLRWESPCDAKRWRPSEKKPRRVSVDIAPRGPALLTSQKPLHCSGQRGPMIAIELGWSDFAWSVSLYFVGIIVGGREDFLPTDSAPPQGPPPFQQEHKWTCELDCSVVLTFLSAFTPLLIILPLPLTHSPPTAAAAATLKPNHSPQETGRTNEKPSRAKRPTRRKSVHLIRGLASPKQAKTLSGGSLYLVTVGFLRNHYHNKEH